MTTEEILREQIARLEGRVRELEEDYSTTLTRLHIKEYQSRRKSEEIKKLSEKLEESMEDMEWLRVCHDRYMKKLESMCCDLFDQINPTAKKDGITLDDYTSLAKRMNNLGLLSGTDEKIQ